jgi:starch-binding outer membrane protein SusE/F
MKKNIVFYLALMGLFTLASCEKDEVKAILLDPPVAPTITVPSATLTLKRAEASQILTFSGEASEYGFEASTSYALEAATAGSNFESPIVIATSDTNYFPVTVGDLNARLLTLIPADQASAIEMRVTSIVPEVANVSSAGAAVTVTTYGYPRLVLSTVPVQSITSPQGDGSYFQYVYLTSGEPFTVTNQETNTVYGGTGGTLSVNGAAFSVALTGWYSMAVNTVAMTYEIKPFMVGLVGSATPGGWSGPDTQMNYDVAKGYWIVTTDLVAGEYKFRLNNDPSWGWNLGGTLAALTQGGANLPIAASGNYTIKLYLTGTTGHATQVKN